MTKKRPPKISTAQLEASLNPSPMRPDFLGYTLRSWQQQIEKLGPVLRVELNGQEQVILCNHETDRRAWKAPDDWLYGSPTSSGDFFLREMGQTHITQQDGAAHKRSRKLLLPGFGVGAMSRDIHKIADCLTEGLAAICDKPVDLHAELCVIYTKALSRSQVKIELSKNQLASLNHFEEWFISGLQLPAEQQLDWHTHPDYVRLKEQSFQLFDEIARERLEGNNQETPTDTLQELLTRGSAKDIAPLQLNELRNLVYLLLVAGVGNIANLASCMSWALEQQPDWHALLQEELLELTGTQIADQLKSGLKQFPRLQATIFETERCFLPAPVVPKTTTRDLDVLGYHVPANTQVQQMIGMAHFDEARYPDAQRFKPQRWLDASTARANAYGGGIHLCLGMGVSRALLPLTLAALVKNHSFTQILKPQSLAIRPDIGYSPLATRFNAVLSKR